MPVPEILRGLERLLGVAIGGFTAYLGFRLFLALPLETDSSGRVVLPGGVSVYLSRIGPGAFFALFGSTIVAFAFAYGIETNSSTTVSTTEPGGGTQIIEKSQSLQGTVPTAVGGGSTAAQRLAEARTHIFTLNRDWPRALRPDLPAEDRRALEVTRDYAKGQILHHVWPAQWGSQAEFDAWVNDGARLPGPASLREPVEVYLAGQEALR